MRIKHIFEGVERVPSYHNRQVTKRFRPTKLSFEIEKQICAEYLDGAFLADLGNKYQIGPRTVWQILIRRVKGRIKKHYKKTRTRGQKNLNSTRRKNNT